MSIADRITAVRARIESAAQRSNRDPHDVRLIAVTKTVDAQQIREAIAAGVTDIGENRVQEAGRKAGELEGLTFNRHLIGHLQTNKAARAAKLFDCVQTVDSREVAVALARHRPEEADPLALLVEVDFTAQPQRSGVPPGAAEALVREIVGLPAVHLMGLMCIAPLGGAEVARASFARLRELRDRIESSVGWALPELSIGMSDDFEIAVEEGATMVRVGRAIFGVRSPA